MKFSLIAMVATVSASANWSTCSMQNCADKWMCCDKTAISQDNGFPEKTGDLICTDPNVRGKVPNTATVNAGEDYFCSNSQFLAWRKANMPPPVQAAEAGASTLITGAAAVALSAYMLA